jgi:N-acetylglucosaminyldiphosphoundecaprenol N-acetyl-beta-D-mannosaminyltransferase
VRFRPLLLRRSFAVKEAPRPSSGNPQCASGDRSAGPRRATVLGCPIDSVDMEEALRVCERSIRSHSYCQHVAINVAKLVALRDDRRLADIVESAGLVTADGQPVVWASRLLGDPLPERVTGIDLMIRLLELAEERGYRVFILGARNDVLERAIDQLRTSLPLLQVAGYRNGYFGDDEIEEVCAEIRDAQADMLFLGLSSPRKEYWLSAHGPTLGVPFVMGVGGAIDIIGGRTRRAPVLLRKMGLEWLFRLAQEPRRLARRYVVTNTRFVWLLLLDVAKRGVFAHTRGGHSDGSPTL